MKCAVDVGFGFTKAVSEREDKMIVFPSVVTKRMSVKENLGFSYHEDYIVNYMNNIYAVGEAALNSAVVNVRFSEDRFISDFAKILTLTSLYLLDAEDDVELALGLPLMLYSKYYDKVRDYFEYREDTIVIDNIAKTFKITLCEIFPQGVGALFAVDEQLPQGIIGLIDIGFRTTDAIMVQNTKKGLIPMVDFSFSIDEGTSRILTRLSDYIQNKYGVSYDETMLLDVFEKETITLRGREISIKSVKDEIISTVVSSIIEKIKAKWNDKLDITSKIYTAGGGAYLISPLLQQFGLNVQMIEDSQFANAKGFLRMLENILSIESE